MSLLALAGPRSVGADVVSGPTPLQEFVITIDSTQLHPPTWWHVPGITPLIWSLDPESTDAFRTTESRELRMKPGRYRYGTFTFDFPFLVTEDGTVEFSTALDHAWPGEARALCPSAAGKPSPTAAGRSINGG